MSRFQRASEKINKTSRYMKSKTTNKDIFTLEVAEDVTQSHKS